MLAQNKCNVIEMFPEQKTDFAAMIPQSVLPDTIEELESALEMESEMQDDEGMDAMPESIFNALLENLLSQNKTRDALMFVVQANLGIRFSDLTKLKLIQFIDVDGQFRHKVTFGEQKTSKVRSFYVNDAIKAAIVIYLKNHPDKKLTDYLFTSEGSHKGYKKQTYVDDRGKKKALRINGKYVFQRDEDGNLIPEPVRRDHEEKVLKNTLIGLGIKLRNDKRCGDGEYKLNTHSLRKLYSEKFSEVAYTLKRSGDLKIDANILALVQLDLCHSSVQTTMRYNKSFDRVKEVVCYKMNLGLPILNKFLPLDK